MKQIIFYLEGRGSSIYHFLIFNIGGLYNIINKIYNISQEDSVKINNPYIVSIPTTEITYPIKIYMQNLLPYQRETFDILKDKFELIEDLSNITNYEIVSIYGIECKRTELCDQDTIIFPFVRNLFLERLNFKNIGRRIFITRKNSELLSIHNGLHRRQILNENELKPLLQKYNIEYIQLEEYTMKDKIKVFMESDIIISPNSAALTLCIFCDKNTRIIEIINKGTKDFRHGHYKNICNVLSLNYNNYTDIIEDDNGNFNLNIEKFEIYFKNILDNINK